MKTFSWVTLTCWQRVKEKVSIGIVCISHLLVYRTFFHFSVRVRPKIVLPIAPAILCTAIQWTFRMNVENRIETFRIICRNDAGNLIDVKEKITMRNVAKFKNDSLKPRTTYHVKIVAVYKDGFEVASDESSFTTLGM